jgi:hypothetical protein
MKLSELSERGPTVSFTKQKTRILGNLVSFHSISHFFRSGNQEIQGVSRGGLDCQENYQERG